MVSPSFSLHFLHSSLSVLRLGGRELLFRSSRIILLSFGSFSILSIVRVFRVSGIAVVVHRLTVLLEIVLLHHLLRRADRFLIALLEVLIFSGEFWYGFDFFLYGGGLLLSLLNFLRSALGGSCERRGYASISRIAAARGLGSCLPV